MYSQGSQAAGRRRNWGSSPGHSHRRGSSSQEQVRLIQLAVCLVLFLSFFFVERNISPKVGPGAGGAAHHAYH